MQLGSELLLTDVHLRTALHGRRVALLGHPASVNHHGEHVIDALMTCAPHPIQLVAAFGPQHGMRGDKQDNMIESADTHDPVYDIPVYSLYGAVRYPTADMLDCFDVLLVDLQDIGTRIYTYVTTVIYLLTACAAANKAVWILDRPNPAGRPFEGNVLKPGWESFVGAAALPMRHGLTLGELAQWFAVTHGLELELRIIPLQDYDLTSAPGYGWPSNELAWVNPSPNAATLNMARCFPGTVLIEGTTLSEGRGTTRALELIGAPQLDIPRLLRRMHTLQPDWLRGCLIRQCYFSPTFHKHVGELCAGLQFHTDTPAYDHHRFRPYRLVALLLKAIRLEYPDYVLWRHFAYEYETERLAIDLLSGSDFLRQWVDDAQATPSDLEQYLSADEQQWAAARQPFLLY